MIAFLNGIFCLMSTPPRARAQSLIPAHHCRGMSSYLYQAASPSALAFLLDCFQKVATAKVLQISELQVVFHLPMAEAALKLGVCSTVLKKICRRNGISRWPYRQIRKIDKARGSRGP